MIRLSQTITKALQNDFLISNSIYLFINNIFGAGVGFLFWIEAANLYSETEIGTATAILSASSLIAGISNWGLGLALIRHINQLPKSEGNHLINTTLSWSILTTILFSGAYLAFLNITPSTLSFISQTNTWTIAFILGTITMTLVPVTDQILLAHFAGKTVFLRSLIMYAIKLSLPLIFVYFLNGSKAVFFTFAIASITSIIYSIQQLKQKLRIHYTPKPNLRYVLNHKPILKYALGNHLGSYLISLPYTIAPLIIIEKFGESIAAQFYIGTMIAMLINSLAMSLSTSAFIQGSTEEGDTAPLQRALKIMTLIILPMTTVLYFISPLLLNLFGNSYLKGLPLIKSLILAAPFSGFALFFVANWRIKNQVQNINIFGLIYTLGLLLPLTLTNTSHNIGFYLIIGNIPAITYGLTNSNILNKKAQLL